MLCKLFGRTRHAFYYKERYLAETNKVEYIVLEIASAIRVDFPNVGTKKLHIMLEPIFNAHNIKIGRDRLHMLLKENGLIVKYQGKHSKSVGFVHRVDNYPNLIKNFTPNSIEQIWIADITYIVVGDDYNFLNLIIDAYSQKIIGYSLHPKLESLGALVALEMALDNRLNNEIRLIHHSDRGSQYYYSDYVLKLQKLSIEPSMKKKNEPRQDTVSEKVIRTLKENFALRRKLFDRETAIRVVHRSIKLYNQNLYEI